MFFNDINTLFDSAKKSIIKIVDISKIKNIVSTDSKSYFKDYTPVFYKNLNKGSLQDRLAGIISRARGISPELDVKMNKFRLTNNIKTVKDLLDSELVVSYILNGIDSIQYLFYPILLEYINSNEVKDEDKIKLVKRLKLDANHAKEINSSDHIPSRRKLGEEGLAYFNKTIKNVVLPYRM